MLGPNGLCFSPDEKLLYIVESRGVPNRKILAYDVTDGGRKLANKRVHIDAGPGTPDGMRCDIDGNLWCGWGMGSPELDGVMVFAPDGKPIGRIALPERSRQRLLRRPQAQPPVHGGEPVGVRALRQYARCARRLKRRSTCRLAHPEEVACRKKSCSSPAPPVSSATPR